MTVTLSIVMSGNLTVAPYTKIFWTVYNAPDNTGAQSGYAGQLTNIAVDSITQQGASVNPLSLTVGGDLSGSLPTPSVSALQGQGVVSTAPTSGQVLQFGNSVWTPSSLGIQLAASFKVVSNVATLISSTLTPGASVSSLSRQLTGTYIMQLSGANISFAWANFAGSSSSTGFYVPHVSISGANLTITLYNAAGSLSDPDAGTAANDRILVFAI